MLLMGVAVAGFPASALTVTFSIQAEFDVTFRGMRADPEAIEPWVTYPLHMKDDHCSSFSNIADNAVYMLFLLLVLFLDYLKQKV